MTKVQLWLACSGVCGLCGEVTLATDWRFRRDRAVDIVNKTTPRGDEPGIALCQMWHPSATSINEATGGLLEPFVTWNDVYPGERTAAGETAVMNINFP